MKKYLTTLLAALIIIINILPAMALEAPAGAAPVIESEAAVLMDARTGQILYEKNMHERLYPASITKIMTVLLGVEHSGPQEVVTMSHDAVFSIQLGASHIALDEGEQITMEQALMAAMLPSANEACNGIAEHISGSVPEFVRLMNERAVQAGALNTNFVNPNGLSNPQHLTTAYDMAMITRAAIQNQEFRRIFGTSHFIIAPTNKQSEIRYLWAEHKMFECGRYEYEGVTGGKTGYTRDAGNTLVTLAQKGDRELIAVAIRSLNHAVYSDTTALLDYGFGQFVDVDMIMPAVTADNLDGSNGETKLAAAMTPLVQQTKTTRLLHRNISLDEVTVDYSLLNPGQPDARLKINMHLANNGKLMYRDLGATLLEIPGESSTTGNVIPNVLSVIIKVIITMIILLFGIRWFFKGRRALRRKRDYTLRTDQVRLPIR